MTLARPGKSLLREMQETAPALPEAVHFTSGNTPDIPGEPPGGGGSSDLVHNDLSGRDAADCHPAASITNTPAGGIVSTNVQDALNELDGELSGVAGTDHYFTVSPDGSKDFTTIAAACAAVVAPSATNRYCIAVYTGRYNEVVVLPIFTSLIGVCDCQKSVEIYSATGPVISFPADATNEACIANLWVACRPTIDAQEVVWVQNGSQIGVKNCYLEWTSATNDVSASMVMQDAGVCTYAHNMIAYAASGTAAGAKIHRAFRLYNGQATIRDNTIELTVNDMDDNLYAIDEDLAGTLTTYIKDNRILASLSNGAATGNGFGYSGSAAGTTKIVQNNRIKLSTAGGAGHGHAIYCDSTAGTSLINSVANIYKVTGFGNNYWAGGGAGDTIYSHFDQIAAAAGKGVGPTYEFVNSPTPGETRVTGDITPDADASLNLGNEVVSLQRWAHLYARELRAISTAAEGDNTACMTVSRLMLFPITEQRFRVDGRGAIADKYYNGVATIIPAAIGTPDAVAIVFGAVLPSANYTVELTGYKQLLIRFGAAFYNVIGVPAIAAVPAKAAAGFTINLQWTAYAVATNAWAGSWDNYNAMVAALGAALPALTTALQIDWRIRMWL